MSMARHQGSKERSVSSRLTVAETEGVEEEEEKKKRKKKVRV